MTERKKICVITGANAGIGKAAAIQIAAKGFKVILACRSQKRGELALQDVRVQSASEDVHLLQLDLSLQSSVRQFVQDLKSLTDTVDVLIHNAAHFDISQKQVVLTPEGVESVWATNHIGPVYLTSLLLEQLTKREEGHVVTIASKGLVLHPQLKIDLDDPEFKDKPFSVSKAYYHSKLAQLMYTYWLAEKMKSKNLRANCIRVTNVKIDISRYPNISRLNKFLYKLKSRFSLSAEAMAETYSYLASSQELQKTGLYWNEKNQTVASTAYSRNPEAQEKLMQLTRAYLPKGVNLYS